LGPIPRNLGFVLLVIFAAVCTAAADAPATWLDRLNFYRASAALPPVTEAPSLSAPVSLHARYMVMHDVIVHSEKRRHAEATAEGAAAAAVSNLAGSLRADEPDAWAVDTWMQGPFHAVGILDPALRQVGFGIHRAHKGRIQTAAGLDVIRGRAASAPPSFTYPVVWPADGTTVPLSEGIEEYPNPLASCRGFKTPTGLPLIVQVGAGEGVPQVTASWIFDGDHPVAHCVFDESTYRNRNQAEQRLGRSILAARDAIVLIPRDPLVRGRSYRALIEVDGRHIDWTFTVGSSFALGETP
jgi:hypothetical protein